MKIDIPTIDFHKKEEYNSIVITFSHCQIDLRFCAFDQWQWVFNIERKWHSICFYAPIFRAEIAIY